MWPVVIDCLGEAQAQRLLLSDIVAGMKGEFPSGNRCLGCRTIAQQFPQEQE